MTVFAQKKRLLFRKRLQFAQANITARKFIIILNHDLVNLNLILLYLFAEEKSRGSVSKHAVQKFPLVHFICRHVPPDHLLRGGKSH